MMKQSSTWASLKIRGLVGVVYFRPFSQSPEIYPTICNPPTLVIKLAFSGYNFSYQSLSFKKFMKLFYTPPQLYKQETNLRKRDESQSIVGWSYFRTYNTLS